MRASLIGLVAMLCFAATACTGDAGREPTAPDVAAPAALSAASGGFTHATLLIRPAQGSESQVFGVMQAWFTPPNPILPPSPVVPPSPICEVPAVQSSGGTLAFCAELQNHAGETLEGAVFSLSSPLGDVIHVRVNEFTLPPGPCAVLLVRGAVALSLEANPGPPNITVQLSTDIGDLVGINPGPPDVSPGPPEIAPGPPNVDINPGPPNTCVITRTES